MQIPLTTLKYVGRSKIMHSCARDIFDVLMELI